MQELQRDIHNQMALLRELKKPIGEQQADTLAVMLPTPTSEQLQLAPSIAHALVNKAPEMLRERTMKPQLKYSEDVRFLLSGGTPVERKDAENVDWLKSATIAAQQGKILGNEEKLEGGNKELGGREWLALARRDAASKAFRLHLSGLHSEKLSLQQKLCNGDETTASFGALLGA